MNRHIALIAAILLVAAAAGAAGPEAAASGDADVAAELREMKQALQAQQQQLEQLRQEVRRRDETIDQMQQRLDRKEVSAAEGRNVAAAPPEKPDSTFTLTPGGFIEAAAIYRTRNENADVGSTYGNVPFDGTGNGHLSEFRGSARQSRLSLLAQGQLEDMKLSGYYEMDFLGAAPTANEVESNSFNLRQRQLWGQLEFANGLSLLGGQAWSLMATNRQGIVPRQEMVPWTIDAQYVVGYNWARQWQARITKRFGDSGLWLALAVENPETTLSVVNPPSGILGFNNSPNATSPSSLFTLNNTPGANGISTDLAPDLTAKIAYDPGWGHYELKLLGRFFRDRFNGHNDYTTGEGLGAAAILPLTEKVNLILEALGGWGIGRYASGVGPDVTLRPDGSIVTIPGVQGMAGLEAHPAPNWDLYAYTGLEYYGRKDFTNALGQGVGYGSPLNDNSGCAQEIPGTCQAQNRLLWQLQPGFWYRFYRGPAGTLQLGMSYSYTRRLTWAGLGGEEPRGTEHIMMSSFRYYLP
jgi:type II secretory pathway pseudopilin PulG